MAERTEGRAKESEQNYGEPNESEAQEGNGEEKGEGENQAKAVSCKFFFNQINLNSIYMKTNQINLDFVYINSKQKCYFNNQKGIKIYRKNCKDNKVILIFGCSQE